MTATLHMYVFYDTDKCEFTFISGTDRDDVLSRAYQHYRSCWDNYRDFNEWNVRVFLPENYDYDIDSWQMLSYPAFVDTYRGYIDAEICTVEWEYFTREMKVEATL